MTSFKSTQITYIRHHVVFECSTLGYIPVFKVLTPNKISNSFDSEKSLKKYVHKEKFESRK